MSPRGFSCSSYYSNLKTNYKGEKKNYITERQFTQTDSSLFVSQNVSETSVEGRNRDANPQPGLLLHISKDTETLLREARQSKEKRLHVVLFCHQQIPARPLKTCLYDPKANGQREPDDLTVFIQEKKKRCVMCHDTEVAG